MAYLRRGRVAAKAHEMAPEPQLSGWFLWFMLLTALFGGLLISAS